MRLPDWLRDKLANPPEAGAGIHAWLFSCARQLHAHMPAAAIEVALTAATASASRRVTGREIRDAVKNSIACAWSRECNADRITKSDGATTRNAECMTPEAGWPMRDKAARRARVADSAADGVAGLVDLFERSPALTDNSADDWLDWLFPGAEWLCLAVDHPATARSRRREKWSFGPADECGLVVPSPMTGPSGRGLDGRLSHRCLDNTAARRWLVIEFDKLEDRKTPMPMDEQAGLHWHFRTSAEAAGWPPLRLVVHSGGKSLHGWYGPVADEERAHELMAYAVGLGADAATWNRCQLVRLPGGRRAGKPDMGNPISLPEGWPQVESAHIEQAVFFFDPYPNTTCPILNNNSSAPGASPASTHRHVPTEAA